ncbi:MAG: hypothetical protein GVY18_13825 [Bacteroidetes bacterium]|jgi:transposase|nr:hypothetical protein [Bacteroidota bacterium]
MLPRVSPPINRHETNTIRFREQTSCSPFELKAFFDNLSDEQKANIQVVCVDRSGTYVECIREELPDAAICYDRFHLVKNFNDVIAKERPDAFRKKRVAHRQRHSVGGPCRGQPQKTKRQ